MSGFRALQAKLQKIEENYFKDLDIDIQELRRANKDLPADQLVRLARDQFGQEAATYLSNKLEDEYDLADYNASDPQPHLDDMIDNAFADDPYDLDYDKYIKKGIDEDEDNWKCSTCGGASQLKNGGDESCPECKGYDYDISNLNNDEDEFNPGGPDPMCDNCAGDGTINLGKKTYNCPECNSGAIDEAVGRVVEVPPELRGTDPSNEAGASSRDAERFLSDLGPDDDVSHDVVDPETGELLDWPTKGLHRDDENSRSQGGTKREKGKREAAARADFWASYDQVPMLAFAASASDPQERAYELLDELRNSDFYNVVWRDSSDVEDPDMMRGSDYDIDVEMPVLLKRKDGKKLTDDDHDNIKEIIKAVKLASTMGNVGIMYAGATEDGTTARFVPSFM